MKYDIKPIHVILKDGTALDCVIYETDGKGELPILDINKIDNKFGKDGKGIHDYIYFQTEMINGKFHPMNVERYIVFENGLETLSKQ